MTSSPARLATTTCRQYASSSVGLTAATGAAAWTLAIVVALSWSATPVCCAAALYFIDNSSNSITENQLLQLQPAPAAISRCSPASHDVLWTRLKLAADPSLALIASDDVDDNNHNDVDVEAGRTLAVTTSSPPGEYQSVLGDTTLQTTPAAVSRHHPQHARRRGERERRQKRRRSREQRQRREREQGQLRHRNGERSTRRRPDGHERRRSSTLTTSWSCRLQKRWKRMPQDMFPAYIQTGSCRKQPTCMMGMYACRARRYVIKVLRRIEDDLSDDGCRPVPVTGPDTVYEEAWTLVDFPVTVACECSWRRPSPQTDWQQHLNNGLLVV